MNLTKLRDNQIQLIEFMEKGGYADSYITKIKNEINRLLKYGEKFDSYQEYYENFICSKISLKNARHKKNILTIIMNFDLYNEYPNRNRQKHILIDSSNYSKLNSYFKNIIDTYKSISLYSEKKEKTIHNEALNCSCFLIYLQNLGYSNLLNIKERDVLSFFEDENGNLKYSHSYEKNIKIVFKTCIPCINECKKILNYFPNIRSIKKNIEYITADEIYKIKTILESDNDISLRNKALVTILLYTGLRSCDIVNLKLDNINWEDETIEIIQSKTEVPLILPLTISVGNAIFNYIENERQNSNIKNIFLREDINYPITKSSIDVAVRNVFKEANIRQDSKRKGTHIFRYNLAINLLENEIPQPIISQVLGHSSSESLKHYLSADFLHLKQCSLNIDIFENIKEVQ